MKAFVLIWLGCLTAIGLVSVLYPPSDTIVNPTTYETVVQPVTVPAQPVDVSVVQRVAVQADALAVAVSKTQGETEAIRGRLQTIEDGAVTKDDVKALRVYVDERDDAVREGARHTWGQWAALTAALSLSFLVGLIALIRTLRKGGRS